MKYFSFFLGALLPLTLATAVTREKAYQPAIKKTVDRRPGILGPPTQTPTGPDRHLYREFEKQWIKDKSE